MNIRFAIKNTAPKATKETDGTIIRFSGTGEPFRRISERTASKVGIDANGNPKLRYVTGLSDNQVKFFKWYSKEEQDQVKKQIEELKPIIADKFGGEDVIQDDNQFFWGENRDVSRLSLSHEDIDVFYDTKQPLHALLYLSIVSGAFIDLVAPTKEWAERHQLPHYLVLETEETLEDEDDITRSDAHAALAELRKEENDALFILAWCLQYDTNAFGAYLKSTPVKTLINYHIQYIDGKLQLKKKRNTPKTFIEYANRWKKQQTRPLLYMEAYIKAGNYFGFLTEKGDKKFSTVEGTALGNTVSEAIETLRKPQFAADFEALRDKVEAKWKE